MPWWFYMIIFMRSGSLPEDDDNYSIRWQTFKVLFSKNIPKDHQSHRSASRIKKRELGVWQRRFWEHRLRDDNDFKRHMDYIHFNPVKHGYVTKAQDWEYSTFHRYVKLGIYESKRRMGFSPSFCIFTQARHNSANHISYNYLLTINLWRVSNALMG